MLLQDIADQFGFSGFIEIEERAVSCVSAVNCVISTGGSVIYSEKSMKRLSEIGTIVYLDVSFPEIMRRIQNISTRGIALKSGQCLENLYAERLPLYQKYAEITVSGDGKTVEELVTEIASKIRSCS